LSTTTSMDHGNIDTVQKNRMGDKTGFGSDNHRILEISGFDNASDMRVSHLSVCLTVCLSVLLWLFFSELLRV